MSKKRYIEINGTYYPIDSMIWIITPDNEVHGYLGAFVDDQEPLVTVTDFEAFKLISLLDSLSEDLR